MAERGYDSDNNSWAGSLVSGVSRAAYKSLSWLSSSLSGSGQGKQQEDKPIEKKKEKKQKASSSSRPNRQESHVGERKQESRKGMQTPDHHEVKIALPRHLWDCLPYKEDHDGGKDETGEESLLQERLKELEIVCKKEQQELVKGAGGAALGRTEKWDEGESSDDSAFGSMKRLNVVKDCMELGKEGEEGEVQMYEKKELELYKENVLAEEDQAASTLVMQPHTLDGEEMAQQACNPQIVAQTGGPPRDPVNSVAKQAQPAEEDGSTKDPFRMWSFMSSPQIQANLELSRQDEKDVLMGKRQVEEKPDVLNNMIQETEDALSEHSVDSANTYSDSGYSTPSSHVKAQLAEQRQQLKYCSQLLSAVQRKQEQLEGSCHQTEPGSVQLSHAEPWRPADIEQVEVERRGEIEERKKQVQEDEKRFAEMRKQEEEIKTGKERLQKERWKLEAIELEMRGKVQQQYEILQTKVKAAEEQLLRDELRREEEERKLKERQEELFKREMELSEEQAKMEKEKMLKEGEMQYRAMEEEKRERELEEWEESLTRREANIGKEVEQAAELRRQREERLITQAKDIIREGNKVQEKQEELIRRETRFKEEQAKFEERKNRGEMKREMTEEDIRGAWKEREENVTRREAKASGKAKIAEEEATKKAVEEAKIAEEEAAKKAKEEAKIAEEEAAKKAAEEAKIAEAIKEEIFILDEEYQELLRNRVELLQHGQLVLDRQQVVSNISADVTPQRALDKLGRTDFANMRLLDHVVQEVRNRSDALVLHYRLNNNLSQDTARQTTDKLGDVMGSIKAEIRLMRDQGFDLTRSEIENLADVVLTDRSKTDMNKVTSNLTQQLAEWARVLEKIQTINRRYVNGHSLYADFSVHRVQLIMQCLDPNRKEDGEDRVPEMFSMRAVALDYRRALENTNAGIALMAKAKHLNNTKLPIIVETAALEDFKAPENKLTNGKEPNFYHWRKNILTTISQFGVKEKDQPKVILGSTDGQAASIIQERVKKARFSSGAEVIQVLMEYFGDKEELVEDLVSRHVKIGRVHSETSMAIRFPSSSPLALLRRREELLRHHEEALEDMQDLLQDEEAKGSNRAELLTKTYMKTLRNILPKETLKTKTTARIDKLELFQNIFETLKEEAENAISELHDAPKDGTEGAEESREVQEKPQKDVISGTVKWFNVRRRHGFITRNDTGEDVFVHQSQIKENPNKKIKSIGDGEEVEFSLATELGRTWATDVSGPKGAPVKGSQHAA